MAHFYGTVLGKSGSVGSRTGSKKSGLEVQAMSWEGAVRVRLLRDEEKGRDVVEISAGPHGNAGVRTIYKGPVAELWAGAYSPVKEAA